MIQLMIASATMLFATVAEVQAGVFTLDALDSGNYSQVGFHNSTIENYLVRTLQSANRNFLVFDLSSITDPIVGATLRLESPLEMVFLI